MWEHLQKCIAEVRQAAETTGGRLHIAEAQLTWLLYIMGVVIAGHCGDLGDECTTLDAQLSVTILQLSDALGKRFVLPDAVDDEHLQNLERAFLFFLREFRRVFMAEDVLENQVFSAFALALVFCFPFLYPCGLHYFLLVP